MSWSAANTLQIGGGEAQRLGAVLPRALVQGREVEPGLNSRKPAVF